MAIGRDGTWKMNNPKRWLQHDTAGLVWNWVDRGVEGEKSRKKSKWTAVKAKLKGQNLLPRISGVLKRRCLRKRCAE